MHLTLISWQQSAGLDSRVSFAGCTLRAKFNLCVAGVYLAHSTCTTDLHARIVILRRFFLFLFWIYATGFLKLFSKVLVLRYIRIGLYFI